MLTMPVFTAESRKKERKALSGLLPGKMFLEDDLTVISCRPINISDYGLGIISTHKLEIGQKLILRIKNMDIMLKVIWKKEDFTKKNLNRYGLMTLETTENIKSIFSSHGCYT